MPPVWTPRGEHFDDILQFKKLLLQDEEAHSTQFDQAAFGVCNGSTSWFRGSR